MKAGVLEYDLAYGVFAFCGLAALFMSAIEAGLPDPNTATGLGLLLAIPLLVASGGAMLAGVAMSIRLRNHRPLLMLSGMSVLLIAAMLTEFGTTKLFFRSVTVVYGIVVVVISGAWFSVVRTRHFPASWKYWPLLVLSAIVLLIAMMLTAVSSESAVRPADATEGAMRGGALSPGAAGRA